MTPCGLCKQRSAQFQIVADITFQDARYYETHNVCAECLVNVREEEKLARNGSVRIAGRIIDQELCPL